MNFQIRNINLPNREQVRNGFFVIILLVIMFFVIAFNTSCPSCKKWFVRSVDRYEVTGREHFNETRTEYREERDVNGNTRSIPYTVWVNVEVTHYHNWCHCTNCDYQWEDNTSTRREW